MDSSRADGGQVGDKGMDGLISVTESKLQHLHPVNLTSIFCIFIYTYNSKSSAIKFTGLKQNYVFPLNQTVLEHFMVH